MESIDPILSNESRRVLELIFWASLSGPFSIIGSIANIINIIIFVKQGFRESVNVSLCGLAISDLGALLFLIWGSISYNPLFRYSNINFDSANVQYITSGWPHGFCIRITSWITAFISFERCFCIALPLKVKIIITPSRTFLAVSIIYLVMLASVIPIFCAVHLAPNFNHERNKTMYGLTYRWNGMKLESITFSINAAEQLVSFVVVIICTLTLIYNLKANSDWRHKATVGNVSATSQSTSVRDKRVMKMVTLISSIFIACFFPSAVNIIMMATFSKQYNSEGDYRNSYHISWAIINIIEVINGTVSIIVYYNLSSKFRQSFKELFRTSTKRRKV